MWFPIVFVLIFILCAGVLVFDWAIRELNKPQKPRRSSYSDSLENIKDLNRLRLVTVWLGAMDRHERTMKECFSPEEWEELKAKVEAVRGEREYLFYKLFPDIKKRHGNID